MEGHKREVRGGEGRGRGRKGKDRMRREQEGREGEGRGIPPNENLGCGPDSIL